VNGRWPSQEMGDWWVKPEFSRFAVAGGRAPHVQPEATGWVAQKWLPGPEHCAFAIAERGELIAFTCYPSVFRAGAGASVAFVHQANAAIHDWVQTFVRRIQFTGQIGFDFRQDEAGQWLPLECNPRATSGLHLLKRNPRWLECLWNQAPSVPFQPINGTAAMLAIPFLLGKKSSGWGSVWKSARDVVWELRDPLPALWNQPRSLIGFGFKAWQQRVSLNEIFTRDIEWNGI
jgi:hypothetical protein